MTLSTSNFLLKYESSIHNNAFSSENVMLSESGVKYAQIMYRLQLKTVPNSFKQWCWWISMWGDNKGDGLFHWRKHYYCYFAQKWWIDVKTP